MKSMTIRGTFVHHEKPHAVAGNNRVGARSLGRVGPNGVLASPILRDPPLSGKGPSMSSAIVLASSVVPSANITPAAAKAIDPTEGRRQRGMAIAAVTRITQQNGHW